MRQGGIDVTLRSVCRHLDGQRLPANLLSLGVVPEGVVLGISADETEAGQTSIDGWQ